MTTQLVVASHGELAAGIKSSVSMLVGEPEAFAIVGLFPGFGPEDLIEQFATITQSSDSDSTLFLVDLFGGTPYNAAARFVAEFPTMDIVSGVNLPMVIDVLMKRMGGADLSELVAAAQTAGTSGIKAFQEVFAAQQAASGTDNDEESDEL